MIQADSVLSTPRKDSPEQDRKLASAFMGLEGEIIDLDRMGQIAFMVAQSPDDDELLMFSVHQFHKMAADLRKKYASNFAPE
jgi:hypothetical protein